MAERGDNVFRATYPDGGRAATRHRSGAVKVDLKRRASKLTLGGPGKVKDEKSVEIRVRWMTGNGEPVSGR